MSDIKQYRKKPVIVEAVEFTPELALACFKDSQKTVMGFRPQGSWDTKRGTLGYAHIDIRTLEGTMRAELCDFIIRGVKGEFYPCKPDIFAATYEEVPRVP